VAVTAAAAAAAAAVWRRLMELLGESEDSDGHSRMKERRPAKTPRPPLVRGFMCLSDIVGLMMDAAVMPAVISMRPPSDFSCRMVSK
jgi:hypothetical protein